MSKPLTKAVIVESVHNRLRIPRKECAEIIEILLETIKSTLASGEEAMVSARRVVRFKCSATLRSKVNGG